MGNKLQKEKRIEIMTALSPGDLLNQMKHLEQEMLQIQQQIYRGYDKPEPTGSLDQKMISLHYLLDHYSSLRIQKNEIENTYRLQNQG